jgi:serine/threonine-protein kinase RsbW
MEGRALTELRAPATLESLKQFMQFVSHFAGMHGFAQRRVREIELATEEALLNILNHAYSYGHKGDIEIKCEIRDDGALMIRIVDTGIPFNLLALADPILNAPLSEREPGGLGVFLIRQMIDEIRYHRDGNRNILTFIARRRSSLDSGDALTSDDSVDNSKKSIL